MSDKESITAKGGTELNADAVRAIPLLISAAGNTVPITVQQRTSVAPAEAFRLIVPIDLSSVFHRVAPFPASKAVVAVAWFSWLRFRSVTA